MTVIHNKTAIYLKNFILNSCTLSISPVLEIKKLLLVGKLLKRLI